MRFLSKGASNPIALCSHKAGIDSLFVALAQVTFLASPIRFVVGLRRARGAIRRPWHRDRAAVDQSAELGHLGEEDSRVGRTTGGYNR